MLRTRADSHVFDKRRGAARALVVTLAILSALSAAPALAQDAGVSGIPPGPANVNGLNNSIRDPSGVGNAARIPAIPPPSTAPIPVPGGVPLTSTTPAYSQRARVRYNRQWRHLPKRQRQKLERAAVKENNRLLGHGLTSICRGC
jgi:hypothetical protein